MTRTSEPSELGLFYTPPELARWLAREIWNNVAGISRSNWTVLDPACGGGELLDAMRQTSNASLRLMGIDIRADAISTCRQRFGHAAHLKLSDALDPACTWGESSPDMIVVNPPWGGRLAQSAEFYRNSGYSLARGQFDTADLFVERALYIAKPGAVLGFILPDSLFQPEHRALRELLLQQSLLLIARLGEGVFKDVNRSTVVVVARKDEPDPDHAVECLHLSALVRRRLVQGELTYEDAKQRFSHSIPQTRFAKNTNSEFNISQSQQDHFVIKKFLRFASFDWANRVVLGRGVEIGKRGITVRCTKCGTHRAAPSTDDSTTCTKCSAKISATAPRKTIIESHSNGSNWLPVIVGENVDRYSVNCNRYIQFGVSGIRYKPIEHFAARKLLIRKTGVGLRAAIDESGSATIQTVFYALASNQDEEWILDYLQGVINSRAMLAWYLRWTGENQWRSHPYITHKVIRALPIPDPITNTHLTKLSRSIAKESNNARNGIDSSEYVVDELVCRLYGLDGHDRIWIGNVLSDTEDRLTYFNHMKTGTSVSAYAAHALERYRDQ